MKLDPTVMRTMDRKDFKVLEAVEQGMKNHAIVPGPLVAALADLRYGGSHKIISSLLRDKLLSHESKKGGYDGYRLTNAGYDILALHNLKTRGFVTALGDRIGTGKESDVYLACSKDGTQHVLKMHRLGRTSFRNVRQKRDYFNNASKKTNGQPNSWLFLSRLSAIKEFAFMKALHSVNYPTPTPVAHNRHVVVMSLVRGVPLYQVPVNQVSVHQARSIFQQATDLAVRLAQHGLVHCDLNEFNLLVDMSGIQDHALTREDPYVRHSGMSVASSSSAVAVSISGGALSGIGPWDDRYYQHLAEGGGEALQPQEAVPPAPKILLETGEPKPIVTLIDFPQMVSTHHPNAQELYQRDLECLRKFFVQKMQCEIPAQDLHDHLVAWDQLQETTTALQQQQEQQQYDDHDVRDGENNYHKAISKLNIRLDVELKASGYSVEDAKRELELFYYQTNEQLIHTIVAEEEDGEEDEEESDDVHDDDDYEEEDEETAEEDKKKDEKVTKASYKPNATTVGNEEDPASVTNDNDFGGKEEPPEMENGLGLVVSSNPLKEQERRQLEEIAKQRVRKQLEEQKKKGKKNGAFRATRNQNKRYVKGTRVMEDFGL